MNHNNIRIAQWQGTAILMASASGYYLHVGAWPAAVVGGVAVAFCLFVASVLS